MTYHSSEKKTLKHVLLRDKGFLDPKITRDIPTTKFAVLFCAFYFIKSSLELNISDMKILKNTLIRIFCYSLYVVSTELNIIFWKPKSCVKMIRKY